MPDILFRILYIPYFPVSLFTLASLPSYQNIYKITISDDQHIGGFGAAKGTSVSPTSASGTDLDLGLGVVVVNGAIDRSMGTCLGSIGTTAQSLSELARTRLR